MKMMLNGPEIVESGAFIDEVIMKEGITILKCNDVKACLKSIQAYFGGDLYYDYKVLTTEIHLTIRQG